MSGQQGPVERFIARGPHAPDERVLAEIVADVPGEAQPRGELAGRYRGASAMRLLRAHRSALERVSTVQTDLVVGRADVAVELGTIRARRDGMGLLWRLVIVYRIADGRLVEADVFVHGEEPLTLMTAWSGSATG